MYGNLKPWWSPESWEAFENKTMCIEEYYSSFTVNKLHVDGQLTLGENIADIGGQIQAYQVHSTVLLITSELRTQNLELRPQAFIYLINNVYNYIQIVK